jgi:adenylosuccinate synthase
MAVTALIGAQWGDEGKGHLVDLLAAQARLVVRYGGGNNAGHTVVNPLGTFKLRLVPSGIFDTATRNVIGPGVVIDPAVLSRELEELEQRGISTANLFISERAHLIMPWHVQLDKLQESARGAARIGTTGSGIGPAYADKMQRVGLRAADLRDPQQLAARIRSLTAEKSRLLERLFDAAPLDADTIIAALLPHAARLAPHVVDVHPLIQQSLREGLPVLLEGAQGALLDIDHGTYPFVTSSPPGTAGACQGSGIAPTSLTGVLGVVKAYATRVGAGPFPTETDGATADELRQIGRPWAEVGTVTGRLRRVGWFDAVMTRYVVEINGITQLAVTKLDVMDQLPELQICTAYELDGQLISSPPSDSAELARCTPVYETMPGWQSSTSGIRAFNDLPLPAQAYLARLAELCSTPIAIVSVGPGREQVIHIASVF